MAVDYLQKMHRLLRRYSFRPFQLTSFDSTFVQGGKADFQLEQFQSSVFKFALKTIFSVPDWIFSNNCLQVLTKMRRIHTGIAPSQQH